MTVDKVNLDDLLVNYVGDFGKYQMIQFTLLIIPCIYISMQSVSWTFTGAMLDHRCRIPGEVTGSISGEVQDGKPEVIFSLPSGNHYIFDSGSAVPGNKTQKIPKADLEMLECFRPPDISQKPLQKGLLPKTEHHFGSSAQDLEHCDSWVYDHSEISQSAVDRWDIVCDRKFWRATVQSMYYVGQALGSIGFGWIGDRWGRKCAFIIATWLLCLSSISMAVVPWIELFAALRLIAGLSHPGIFVIAVIMGMELVGPSKRAAGSIAANLAFSIGQIGLAFFAYFFRDYQCLQLVLSVPCVLFLAYYWLIPGSLRWLISQNRFLEADKILRRVARINGRGELPHDWYQELESAQEDSPLDGNEKADSTKTKNERKSISRTPERFSVMDLFRTPQIRKHVLIQFFCWPTVSMVYYGISMDPSFLGGDRYVTFLLSALIEIPGVFFAAFAIDSIGRKALMIGSMGIAGLFMTLTAVVPSPHPWFLIGCVILAKAAITSAYTVIYAWTPELFPTVIRNLATGCCSTMARIGGVMASYMIMLGAEENSILVSLTFGLFCLAAMILSILEPETKGTKTIETIAEAEEFGSRAKTLSFRAPVLMSGTAQSSGVDYIAGGQNGVKENGDSCAKLLGHENDSTPSKSC